MGIDTNYAESAASADLFASWRDRAACAGRPPATLELCWWTCPVETECRRWVMGLAERHDPGGVCGGMTEKQRTHQRHISVGHRARATILANAITEEAGAS